MANGDAGFVRELTRAVAKIEESQESRDRLIVEAVQAGVLVPTVAAAVGLTRARVYQIIQRDKAAAK